MGNTVLSKETEEENRWPAHLNSSRYLHRRPRDQGLIMTRTAASFGRMSAFLASAKSSSEAKDIVSHLKNLISEARSQILRIQTELEDQKKARIKKRKCRPSKPLPAELLLEIFEYYLEEEPRHARRLMLVCRIWYSVVTSHSLFWTRLDFRLDTDGWIDLENYCSQQEPYIQACVKYSRTQRLTIDWDMEKLDWWNNRVINQIFEVVKPLTLCSSNDIIDWAFDLDLDQFIDAGGLPSCHHKHAFKLFSTLIKSGSIERCGVFRLSLSESVTLSEAFLDIFGSLSDMPMLQAFALHLKSADTPRSLRTFRPKWLQSVRSLDLSSLDLIADLDISYSTLSSLNSVIYDWKEEEDTLRLMQNLEELDLFINRLGVLPARVHVLKLPRLLTLRIDAASLHGNSMQYVGWDLPSLEYAFLRLNISSGKDQLPRIAPQRLRLHYTDENSNQQQDLVPKMLLNALLEYKATETLYLQHWVKESAVKVFKKLRKQGVLKGRKMRVVFEEKYYNESMALEELAGAVEEMEVEF